QLGGLFERRVGPLALERAQLLQRAAGPDERQPRVGALGRLLVTFLLGALGLALDRLVRAPGQGERGDEQDRGEQGGASGHGAPLCVRARSAPNAPPRREASSRCASGTCLRRA